MCKFIGAVTYFSLQTRQVYSLWRRLTLNIKLRGHRAAFWCRIERSSQLLFGSENGCEGSGLPAQLLKACLATTAEGALSFINRCSA